MKRVLGTHGRLGASYLDENGSLPRLANLCSLVDLDREPFKLGFVLLHDLLDLLGNC